jgi:hypothetical protein
MKALVYKGPREVSVGKFAFDFGAFFSKGLRMDAYAHFDKRDAGWTKVVLKPNG